MALFVFKKTTPEPEAAPKKKGKLEVIQGGKSKTKEPAKKAAKKAAVAKAKPGPKAKAGKTSTTRRSTVGASVVEMTPKLEKLVSAVDKAYGHEEAVKEGITQALSNLYDFLGENGGSSFKHPKHGLYTVMKRDGQFFWRPKPKGRG